MPQAVDELIRVGNGLILENERLSKTVEEREETIRFLRVVLLEASQGSVERCRHALAVTKQFGAKEEERQNDLFSQE